MAGWTVLFSREARKQYEKLKLSGSKKPSIIDVIDLLVLELQKTGPLMHRWANFSGLGKSKFHCHLKKGHPTYVACWKVSDSNVNLIEVYYVGTHEAAPY